MPTMYPDRADAGNCPEVKVIFARGSGQARWTDRDYVTFRDNVSAKLSQLGVDYEAEDLDYSAIGMDMDNFWAVLGAYFGAGESYEFGRSVDAGVQQLIQEVNHECPNTKYVLGGYSQGAMVISKALHSLDADKIIYAATFGDPKLYLPEGEGIIPAACRGDNLSDYRVYVPDCRAYEGMLGSYRPYEPMSYSGKVGTWCNKYDIFCSSYLSLDSHMAYVSDNLYDDASKMIAAKVQKALGIERTIYTAHDTAILIDSTGSMAGLIDQYKQEALNLAEKTLNAGGRVALYDYRDLNDPYHPVKHCDFETCNMEVLQTEMDNIQVDGGGDTPESLLSASFTVMKELKWKLGATKSLVILTDADYHSPDLDGVTFYDVKKLSQEIDPVNFYIITPSENMSLYEELASATDGKVVNSADDLSLLTEEIMERFDSLPRVEEVEGTQDLPTLKITSIENISETEVKISFETDAVKILVAVNDAIMGVVDENSITISGLDKARENIVSLMPLSENRRGAAETITIDGRGEDDGKIIIPRVPDTGVVRR
ncbi:cutinase family protein [Candidatus Saccharibacteria bacterium]|nr:cutinase family protein [Candidatus Saccharibacteria bacterium]